MKRVDEFLLYADRYLFDFGECHASRGFAQVDTPQDASYFGIWLNPTALIYINYCEGGCHTNPVRYSGRVC